MTKICIPRESNDADLPPAHLVLGRIQDQKQKYTLEWPKLLNYTKVWSHYSHKEEEESI